MLTTTQIALLEAIKASLFDYTPKYPDDTDWNEVVKEAKAQTIMGLISPVIPIKDQNTNIGIANYIRILHEQDQLIKLLDENGISCVILKGFAAAQYYSKPHLRAMGDVDFLVPCNRFHETAKLMESNGYVYTHGKEDTNNKYKEPRHLGYSKNGIEFELHHHFSTPGADIDDILEQAIHKREYHEINGYKIPMLPEIENGLVLLGHINQHLKDYNLGLRQIIDWEMYVHMVLTQTVWNSSFVPLADGIGLKDLAVNVTNMCIHYLGLSNCSYITGDLKTDTLEELINVLFESGNFSRKKSRASKENSEESITSGLYSIKKKGFFYYIQDLGIQRWKICQKHPILKPFAWIYGLFRAIVKGLIIIFKGGRIKKSLNDAKQKVVLSEKLGLKSK